MHFPILMSFSLAASLVAAWIPGDVGGLEARRNYPRQFRGGKTIRAADGMDLFRRQAPSGSNGTRTASLKKGIRGVSLGSLFLFEPWIDQDEWSRIGCNGAQAEKQCGEQLGQGGVNKAFEQHWSSFYTQQDFQDMTSYGLNTIRVPVGFWMYEQSVNKGEIFPQVSNDRERPD